VHRPNLYVALVAGLAAVLPAAGGSEPAADLTAILTRVGQRVEQYYTRAQSIVALEAVRIQPLAADLSPVGFGRRLAYELRVAWDPQHEPGTLPEATVLREILTVNGRKPRESDDEAGCMDPKPVSPEPLGMLLASRRGEYTFSFAGTTRNIDGRAAMMLDYKPLAAGEADIQWKENCVTISLPGRSRGRIWIDAATDDVLRLDDHLVGLFEFRVPPKQMRFGGPSSMVIERADSSIRYRAVQFQDPEERLILPASIETVTVIRGSGAPRVRVTQQLSDYRRFLTGGRLVNR
jgi:hypothetical protein